MKARICILRIAVLIGAIIANLAFNPVRYAVGRRFGLEAEFWAIVVPYLFLMLLFCALLIRRGKD